MTEQNLERYSVLGVKVDGLSIPEAIHIICERAASDHAPSYIVKPYVEFIDRACRDGQITSMLNDAWLSLPDGIALVWATHYLYAGPHTMARFFSNLIQIVFAPAKLYWPLPERFGGITFTLPLLTAAAKNGLRVYLVGSPVGTIIEHTADVLQNDITGLVIAGTHSGRDDKGITDGWISSLATDIKAARADLILIGMGFPLQEQVMTKLLPHLGRGVLIGEGGTFDYEAFGGNRRRAPRWMQRSGLEWLWRLILEPKRLVRQLAVPRFIYRIYRTR